jgi:cytochrome c oxidase assembly factor CtaG
MRLLLRVQVLFSLLFAAAGIWIVIAPTAIGYQATGQPWADATYNDVLVGGLLVLVSLGVLTVQLVATTRARLRAAAR